MRWWGRRARRGREHLQVGLQGLGLVAFLAAIAPRFGGENPLGRAPDPDNWHHEGLTRRAAQAAGWSRPAENALAFHADYLDSYLYNPLWWFNLTEGGGLDRLKVVLSSQHELVKLHFDDLFDPEQVHATWQRYASGTVAGLLWVGTSGFRPEVKASLAHNLIGASLHAVQDFFSHSNWIDDEGRRSVTWFDVDPSERTRMSLWTGSYEQPDHLGIKPHGAFLFACTVINNLGGFGRGLLRLACHAASPLSGSTLCEALKACDEAEAIDVPDAWREAVPDALEDSLVWVKRGINVDSRWLADIGAHERAVPGLDGETAFSTAYDLAVRASCQWLHRLEHIIAEDAGHGGFWEVVTQVGVSDDGYLTDTEPWESFALLPYRFVTAGPYPPPRGFDDQEPWYLRLTITTADVGHAGTNADIVPIVDGQPLPPLDHAPPPEAPEPGEPPHIGAFPSALAHDDFERGSTAAYIVGPLDQRPSRLELLNDAPDVGDVLLAAVEAVADAIVGVFEAIGDFFLSLIGYHADFVDSDHDVVDAATLNALPVGGRHDLDLYCNGGSEGRFRIDAYVEKTAVTGTSDGVPWREYIVHHQRLRCLEESDWDRGSDSDEPFVLGLVIPHGGTGAMVRWRTSPFSDVDSGDVRAIGRTDRVRVPETYGVISVAVAVYESDDESAADRNELLDQFAGQVQSATEEPEQDFLVTLSEAVAAGWRPARVEAVAFRRGRTVEVCQYPRADVHRWVEGGDRLVIGLGEPACTRVEVDLDAVCGCDHGVGLPDLIELPELEQVRFDIPEIVRRSPRPAFSVELGAAGDAGAAGDTEHSDSGSQQREQQSDLTIDLTDEPPRWSTLDRDEQRAVTIQQE